MDIILGKEQVFCLLPTLNKVQAREMALDKKISVFTNGLGGLAGLLNTSNVGVEDPKKILNQKISIFASGVAGGVGDLLKRVRPEDVKITNSICRYEPFWHVTCKVRYVYDRTHDYNVPVNVPEVKSVTIDGKDYGVMSKQRQFTITVLEHCVEEDDANIIFDGVSGQEKDWDKYLGYEKDLVSDLSNFSIDESIIVAPEIHSSHVMRRVLSSLFKSITFETVLEQKAEINTLDLYFRPIYSFEYKWEKAGKTAVAEFDGLTGDMIVSDIDLRHQVEKVMTRDLIFDVGEGAASLLVPGGGIVIKAIRDITNNK